MPHRYFLDELQDKKAILIGDNAHHLANVMRGKIGDKIILCDGKGTDFEAVISCVSAQRVELDIYSTMVSVSEAHIGVTLYVGYPKADKLEWILQKGTELGAIRFVPFYSKFCVIKPKNEELKNQRYNKIVLEAAKQSGRGIVPTVEMPMTYEQMLKDALKSEAAFFCYEGGGASLHSRLSGVKTVSIITGSEGGFSPDEAQKATEAGCFTIGLGPRILRCETAPLAALSSVMTLTGNLQ